MKAVALTQYLPIEDENSLLDVVLEKPTASGYDLLVNVEAVSVNPVDTKVRAPKDTQESTPKVIGWDAAGTVVAVGDKVKSYAIGDKVYYAGDITRPGSNSEYQLVDERIVGHAPKSLSVEESAALPLTTITAWEALFERLDIDRHAKQVNSSKSLLIIGGAGGVGSIAIQLAKWAGLTVIATASKEKSTQWCTDFGADYVINHHGDMKSQLATLGFEYTDYIFCLNQTAQHFDAMVDIIKPQGKICTIVETDVPLDISRLQLKSASFAWELMFTRSMFNTFDIQEQQKLLNEVSRLIDDGIIKHTLSRTYSPINAKNLRQAHKDVEQGTMIGKIVVTQW